MSVEKKVPEIFFKRFGREWENLTLGDLGSVAMNKRIFKHQTTIAGDVPFFKIGTFGKQPDAFISKALFNEYKAKYPYPVAGDLLLSASGSIGRVVEYKGEEHYYQDSNIVWLKHDGKINNSFLKVFYSMVKWSGLEGSTIQRLYNKNILDTEISTPERQEQIAIGNYFQKLDTLINQHQQKHDKLSSIKKALLEKMFPKEGETIPEIRFKGFSGEWKEVTLSSVIDVRSGKDYKHLGKGNIPVYGTGGYMHSVDSALSNDKDAIGIGRKGTIDKPYILRAPFWTVDTLFYAVPLTSFNLDFLFCLFQKIDWKKHDESTGVPSLSKIAINNVPVYATNELEQTAIGNYFQKLDALINQHQQQITKLNNIKQACLSKMFV
ncbi:type I restriction-modification system specificty subunit [Pantoea vagans C9-1]|jgi:type I restriction enzyme S subunit|uniref:restriction endonuclease subunit S n=1 Tax=Pantoea vagans TaxID=470934 RepID=UPI0001E59A63|nr:restriction endonuclease subunit S [Pantoea vagans]ADO11870.1 type I restriction-modification system specificty subunit [Pantoea vagans C9-1]